jgi:hypothetical protein
VVRKNRQGGKLSATSHSNQGEKIRDEGGSPLGHVEEERGGGGPVARCLTRATEGEGAG